MLYCWLILEKVPSLAKEKSLCRIPVILFLLKWRWAGFVVCPALLDGRVIRFMI